MDEQDQREAELDNSAENSPLNEVSPEAMSILVGRLQDNLIQGMPRAVLETDLRKIVEWQKARRREFVEEEKTLKPTRKKRTAEEIDADNKAKAEAKAQGKSVKSAAKAKASKETLKKLFEEADFDSL